MKRTNLIFLTCPYVGARLTALTALQAFVRKPDEPVLKRHKPQTLEGKRNVDNTEAAVPGYVGTEQISPG